MADDDVMSPEEARAAGYAPQDEAQGSEDVMSPEEARAAGYAPPESPWLTAGREALHSLIPSAAAVGPMMAGGAAGFGVAGPVGAFVGAVGAGMVAGGAASYAQEKALQAAGYDDTAERAAGREANPTAAMLGELAPIAVTFNSGTLSDKLVTRLITGGGMGGVDAATQYVEKGEVDPKEVAANAAAGALFNRPRGFIAPYAEAGEQAGAKFAAKFTTEENPLTKMATPDVGAPEPNPLERMAPEGEGTELTASEQALKTFRHAFPGDDAPNAAADRQTAAASEKVKTERGAAPVANKPNENVDPDTFGQQGLQPSVRDSGNDGQYLKGSGPKGEQPKNPEATGVSVGEALDDPTLKAGLQSEAEIPQNARPTQQEGQPPQGPPAARPPEPAQPSQRTLRRSQPTGEGPEWQPPKGDEFAQSNLNATPRRAREVPAAEAQPEKLRKTKGGSLVLGEEPFNAPAASPAARAEPKVVQETIDALKAAGKPNAARAIEVLPPGEARNKMAARLAAAEKSQKGTVPENPATIRKPSEGYIKNTTVEGTLNKRTGKPYRTTSPELAKHYSDVLAKAEQVAFNPKFEPKANETADQVRTRVKAMLDAARRQNPIAGKLPHETYTMRGLDKPKGFSLLRRADQFMKGKIKPEDGIAPHERFLADERLHRGGNEAYEAFENQNRMEATNALGKKGQGKTVAIDDIENALAKKEISKGQAEAASELPARVEAPDENETLAERAAREAREDAEAEGKKPDAMAEYEKDFQQFLQRVPKPERAEVEQGMRDLVNKNPDLLDAKGGFPAIRKMLGKPVMEGMARKNMPKKAQSLDEITEKLKTAYDKGPVEELTNQVKDRVQGMEPPKPSEIPGPKRVDEFSQKVAGPAHEYARGLGHKLEQLAGGVDVNDAVNAQKLAEAIPKDVRAKSMDFYRAREQDRVGSLSPKDQVLYNRWVKPLFDIGDTLFKHIQDVAPKSWQKIMGPEVKNHIYRIVMGENDAKLQSLFGDYNGDPISPRDIAPHMQGPLFERRLFALTRESDGRRAVISPNAEGEGYTEWNNKKPTTIKDPNFEFKDGGVYIDPKGVRYKMEQAHTDELEKHTNQKYYKNAFLSAILSNLYLSKIAGHLEFMQSLKKDPEFLKWAQEGMTAEAAKQKAANGGKAWTETKLDAFNGWKMVPELANVLDHYARPGFDDNTLAWLSNLNQGITRLMFWMPTAHLMNVGAHWFVSRGFDWIKPAAYKRLYETGADAIKSVMTQDALQFALRDVGTPLMAKRGMNNTALETVGKSLGEHIQRNQKAWDPIAKVFGMGASELADRVYKASSHVMWAGNDMFLTQTALELKQKHPNWPLDQIAIEAARHFPSYRTPPTIFGTGDWARAWGKIIREPAAVVFGPYHYGAMNAYAHMVKDLLKKGSLSDPDRVDAVGKFMALGLLAFAVKPVLDKMAQLVSGEKDATAHPRGPLALPSAIARTLQGKGELSEAAQTTFTMSPAYSTVMQALTGRDFAGRHIVERGQLAKAAKGNIGAGIGAAGQGAEFLARGLIPPLNTAENAWAKGSGPLRTIAEQALDVKTLSPGARKYEAQAYRKSIQEERARIRKPRGFLEQGLNKLGAY